MERKSLNRLMEQKRSADRRKYHVIYCTTCIITGRYYVGMHSTDDLDDGYVGSGKLLWRSIRKHGLENHVCEILEHLPSRKALQEREAEIVSHNFILEAKCMNLIPGGQGGGIGHEWTEVSRKKATEAAIVRMARMKADGSWDKVLEKNKQSHIGKILSADHKAAIGQGNLRYKALNGPRKFSEAAVANIAESLIGNSRNKKTWTLLNLNTGDSFKVENLTKWVRERNYGISIYTVYEGTFENRLFEIVEMKQKYDQTRVARNQSKRARRALKAAQ